MPGGAAKEGDGGKVKTKGGRRSRVGSVFVVVISVVAVTASAIPSLISGFRQADHIKKMRTTVATK